MLEEKLAKSLDEIEAKADEVLSKSEETEEIDAKIEVDEEVEKSVKPEDVSKEAVDGKEETDEGKEEGEEEETDEGEEEEKEVKKSITDEFLENDKISKSLEVSDFLSEFTKINGGVLDGLRADINKSLDTSTHTATILAKSFNAIMKSQEGLTDLVKSQAKEITQANDLIKSLQSRLDEVEKQPAVRKSIVTPIEKSFDHSAGLANAAEPQELSKSEKIQKLTDMAMNGENGVTVNDVVAFESTGTIRPELETYLK